MYFSPVNGGAGENWRGVFVCWTRLARRVCSLLGQHRQSRGTYTSHSRGTTTGTYVPSLCFRPGTARLFGVSFDVCGSVMSILMGGMVTT
jgi:hypothetical protein